jgi:hypothetical protein
MKNVNNFLVFVIFLTSIVSGIIIGVIIALIINFNIKHIQITNSDAISIANTYIVFISIFFILFTIAITIASFIFSKLFFTEKIKEIHQNIVIISNELKKDETTRKVFFDEIFKEGPILDEITKQIINVIEEIEKDIKENTSDSSKINNIKKRIRKRLKK